jgi:RimJ/RimL family protein N-acetyltransferase
VSATINRLEPAAAASPARTLAWAHSRRLALREFGPHDHEALLRMHRDPRLRAHLVDDYPLHRSAVARLFLERIAQIYRRHEGLGIWHASLLEAQPVFAGWFNLMPMAERPSEVEIGSRLLPQVWGSGLALEGGELLLDHAFDRLGLTRVWGICHPANRSALAVLAALGFDALGLMPYDGGNASHHRIELNAWRVLRNTPRATRLRRALRSQASGKGAVAVRIEEQHA